MKIWQGWGTRLAVVVGLIFGLAVVQQWVMGKLADRKAERVRPAEVPTVAPVTRSSVDAPQEAPPSVFSMSFAQFRGDHLAKCTDIDLVRDDQAETVMKRTVEDFEKINAVKLVDACSLSFPDRLVLAICGLGRAGQDRIHMTYYLFEDVFEEDAKMKECLLEDHGNWQAVARGSDAFVRAKEEYRVRRHRMFQKEIDKLTGSVKR